MLKSVVLFLSFQVADQLINQSIEHWDLESAVHYAKFIPRVYFFHKKIKNNFHSVPT